MNNLIYEPIAVCTDETYNETFQEVYQKNLAHLDAIEEKVIATGSLLYRFLYESVADGKAIYQIIKLNKKTARVRLCRVDGLYDDYVVPQWGMEATVPLDYVKNSIRMQDAWRTIVQARNGKGA